MLRKMLISIQCCNALWSKSSCYPVAGMNMGLKVADDIVLVGVKSIIIIEPG